MKKDTLQEIILGTVGGLIFAIGMCMCLIPEWNTLVLGIIVAIVGLIILAPIYPIYRKNNPRKVPRKKDWGLIGTITVGIVGSLILGTGMSLCIGEGKSMGTMILGMVIGVVGLLICALVYPVYLYKTDKKK
jgi:uncharacterized membrane protein YeaQ/YmgE (transglycosylase-associated protein family)